MDYSRPLNAPADSTDCDEDFAWSALTVVKVMGLFLLAGVAEIGGGWLVWQAIREGKNSHWAIAGSIILIVYGVIPTLQPLNDFGRLYAVYGGFFIAGSYIWGHYFDGMVLDMGDLLGSCVALAGVLIILFWPRNCGNN